MSRRRPDQHSTVVSLTTHQARTARCTNACRGRSTTGVPWRPRNHKSAWPAPATRSCCAHSGNVSCPFWQADRRARI
eukprot:scaffold34011_cov42-Phaeocystis_antarctica.AAC.1